MGLFVQEPIQTTQSDVAPGVVRRHTDDVVTHRRDDVVTRHKADAVSHHTGDAVRCPSVTHSVNPVTRWCSHSSRPSRLSTNASEMGTIWLTSSYSLVMYKSTMYSVYFFKSLSLPLLLFLRQGVPNLGANVVAGLKPPFCKNRPLLVGFTQQTRAQKTRAQRPRLLGPRLHLKTN